MSNLLLWPAAEPSSPSQPPDAAVRADALGIRRSFIVQAPAGSGKTALLIQRFLKLLGDESVTQPEQVLAITFTNAATAELRNRVLEQLAKAEQEAADDLVVDLAAGGGGDFARLTIDLAHQVLSRDAALGWQLLTNPHRLNIRTIDSVCAEIARSLPVLSGSGGGLAPVLDAGALHREAARRTLLLLGGGDPAFDAALRNLLLHRDGNLADCETLLAQMLDLRDQWGELMPRDRRELDDSWLDAVLLPGLQQTLESAIGVTLARLDAIFPRDLLHDLASLAGHLGHLHGLNSDPSPIACCAGRHDTLEPVAAHLDRWRALIHLLVTADCCWRKRLTAGNLKFELDKNSPRRSELQNILDQLRDQDDLLTAFAEVRGLPDAQYPADQWTVAKSLFRVLSRALVELQLVFAARRESDFTELGLLARAALRTGAGAADLAAALGARLQHLLVDEMQDTSAGQYELIELLTASWDGHSQTVFLVGDPCQSIYLFRQARVERFLHALETERLGEIPLTRLSLTTNFRSQRGLVEQFNDDFASIFSNSAQHDAQYSLRYVRAEASRPSSVSSEGRVWHANPQPRSSAVAEDSARERVPPQARRDADTIAAIADEWMKRPLPADRAKPWKLAVLVRSRNHLAEIVPALRRKEIPFRAIDIETLQERQEVLDLTALTRALLHPADRVATLAVLRAPWCGLSLADLHALTGADDASLRERSVLRLIDERAQLLSSDSQLRLARVQHVLRSAAQLRSRLSTAQLVERAWRSLGGDAPLTTLELVNARRFFELLDALEASAGRVDPAQLEDRLAQLYAEPDPVPATSACVELLTIHKAKGLEWDVVFIPALEGRPAVSPPRLLTWAVLDELEDVPTVADVMLAPIAARGEEVDSLTRWLKQRHREREYAENKRLFYVACTRAKEELHLFAAPVVSSSGVSRGPVDTLLGAAWPAAQSHFAGAHSTATRPKAAEIASTPDDESDGNCPESSLDISFIYNDSKIASQVLDANLVPSQYSTIRRLPASFDPAVRLAEAQSQRFSYGQTSTAVDRAAFLRPEGSFSARAFGNAVHALAELAAAQIASGVTCASLLAELPSWSSRIKALLRADGLAAADVTRFTRETRAAIETLLRDPDGQWLIGPHPGAASELSLTAASDAGLSSVRADRVFLAGPRPHAAGQTHLWIVDYKTASTNAANTREFLTAQRAAYAQQLAAYARVLAPAHSIAIENVRLALYFPALPAAPRFLWWTQETEMGEEAPLDTELELRTEN